MRYRKADLLTVNAIFRLDDKNAIANFRGVFVQASVPSFSCPQCGLQTVFHAVCPLPDCREDCHTLVGLFLHFESRALRYGDQDHAIYSPFVEWETPETLARRAGAVAIIDEPFNSNVFVKMLQLRLEVRSIMAKSLMREGSYKRITVVKARNQKRKRREASAFPVKVRIANGDEA
jgi:hypothetical protein